jgi:hypothetical protein
VTDGPWTVDSDGIGHLALIARIAGEGGCRGAHHGRLISLPERVRGRVGGVPGQPPAAGDAVSGTVRGHRRHGDVDTRVLGRAHILDQVAVARKNSVRTAPLPTEGDLATRILPMGAPGLVVAAVVPVRPQTGLSGNGLGALSQQASTREDQLSFVE